MKTKYLVIPLIFFIIISSSLAGATQQKNNTSVQISSYREGSNFYLCGEGDYIYNNILINLHSYKSSNSSYEIYIDDNLNSTGEFNNYKQLNLTLEGGRRTNIRINIDNDVYVYQLFITRQTIESGWHGTDTEEEVTMSITEWIWEQREVFLYSILGGIICLPISYKIGKSLREMQIEEGWY